MINASGMLAAVLRVMLESADLPGSGTCVLPVSDIACLFGNG
jgi:hypothetical protein